jgi:predicted ATPase/DNA-binding XRE family transcriptional regulator
MTPPDRGVCQITRSRRICRFMAVMLAPTRLDSVATDMPAGFGELLRRFRVASGFSQDELAERAGLSAHGISDLERGARNRPYPATVHRLSQALSLSETESAALQMAARPTVVPTTDEGSVPLPGVLPVSLSTFVGREREVADLRLLLGTTRLLTLTGTGGVGKTRLALRLVSNLTSAAAVNLSLVELASLSDGALVDQTVLAAMGGREVPGQSALDTLVARVGTHDLLLVLDNCEHLVDACAHLVDNLLRHCPSIRVLVTSREVLGVPGETLWSVPSLSVPDARAVTSVASLSRHEAVQLFVERARQSKPDFTLTDENAASVAQICRRLDGVPLALELAAARVRLLSVAQIAERLDDRFRLLTGGGRTVPERHQTLRAALDWSYDVLGEPERVLLQRLAVFAGGGTLEAAEAVCAGDGIDQRDVLELLGRLVDRSLVLAEERGSATRFRLLETIRAYAIERLDRADEVRVRRRHRDWYLQVAEASEPGFLDPRHVAHFEHDYDNFRLALRWSIDEAELEPGMRLGVALWLFWYLRGLYAEGSAWLAELLAVSGGQPLTTARAAALHWSAHLSHNRGEYRLAQALLSESAEVSRQLGYERGLAICALLKGNSARDMGDSTRSRQHYEEALERLRRSGDWTWQVVTLSSFGHALCDDGDYVYAESVARECLELSQARVHVYGIGRARYVLGRVAAARGDVARALELLAQALQAHRELPYHQGIVWTLHSLAPVLIEAGELVRAREVLAEGITLAMESGQRLAFAQGLEAFAEIFAEAAPESAVQAAAAAAVLRDALAAPVPTLARERLEARLAITRQRLGEAAWSTVWANGRALSPEQARNRALAARFPAESRSSRTHVAKAPGV